ncbi:hypothetical protein FSOLCH5_009425 [Fusarium solani]
MARLCLVLLVFDAAKPSSYIEPRTRLKRQTRAKSTKKDEMDPGGQNARMMPWFSKNKAICPAALAESLRSVPAMHSWVRQRLQGCQSAMHPACSRLSFQLSLKQNVV